MVDRLNIQRRREGGDGPAGGINPLALVVLARGIGGWTVDASSDRPTDNTSFPK